MSLGNYIVNGRWLLILRNKDFGVFFILFHSGKLWRGSWDAFKKSWQDLYKQTCQKCAAFSRSRFYILDSHAHSTLDRFAEFCPKIQVHA